MSLILKGINLPNKGNYLNIAIFADGTVYTKTNCGEDTETAQAVQIPKDHGRLKDFDGDGVHPIIIDGEYMVKVDDLDRLPTILEAEE